MKTDNQKQIEKLIQSFGTDLENKIGSKLSTLEKEVIKLQNVSSTNQTATNSGLELINKTTSESQYGIMSELGKLRELQTANGDKANKNTDEIIKAMGENNKLTAKKFDEFSELLSKNNTEALVEVMKKATEQFNEQMSELINRLVKENFAELNNSVKSLNDWQHQNKEQVQKLTEQFQKTTELFNLSATTLKEVSENTKALTAEDSKLSQIVQELKRVMIEDGKFQAMTEKLNDTIETLEETGKSFNQTTSELNQWVQKEINFRETAEILIVKLEEFRDLKGDLWQAYRAEMRDAVNVIKEASQGVSNQLDDINQTFYDNLNTTLVKLEECIERFRDGN